MRKQELPALCGDSTARMQAVVTGNGLVGSLNFRPLC
jgi:hypothetical protein